MLKGYYEGLKVAGMPFAKDTSSKYGPLTQAEFGETLYEFALKAKSSPMSQLADLYLWPICMGGYHKSNWTYRRLVEDGKFVEATIPDDARASMGSKYSCFDDVKVKP